MLDSFYHVTQTIFEITNGLSILIHCAISLPGATSYDNNVM